MKVEVAVLGPPISLLISLIILVDVNNTERGLQRPLGPLGTKVACVKMRRYLKSKQRSWLVGW